MNPRIARETWSTLRLVRAASGRVCASMRESLVDLAPLFPLTVERSESLGKTERLRLDAFLKRFENLIELNRRRMFRGALMLAGEDSSRMSSDDVAFRLEALDLLGSADAWLDACEVRNLSAHEYPEAALQTAKSLNETWAAAQTALQQADGLLSVVDARYPDLLQPDA